MSRQDPTSRDVARALWLLGLADPESIEEVRVAWKDRVARSHPDRRSDHPDAANVLTAAFNAARDVCERWAATGRDWPSPRRSRRPSSPPEPTSPRRASDRRAPVRRPRHDGWLRPGDLVRRPGERLDDADESARVVLVTADGEGSGLVHLADGSRWKVGDLAPAAYGCPVCGHCEGPLVEHPARRPCPDCLESLAQLERPSPDVDGVVREMRRRAAAASRQAAGIGHPALLELARERVRWSAAVAGRPREERLGALLGAFGHAFAVAADRRGQ